MSTSSPERDDPARNTPNDGAHIARLFALADQIDFLEQLDHAGRLIDRRREELLSERQRARNARERAVVADRERTELTEPTRTKGGTPR